MSGGSGVQRWDVMMIREYTDASGQQKSWWTKIGTGFTNRNGSINIELEAVPFNQRLQLQIPLDRSQRGQGGGYGNQQRGGGQRQQGGHSPQGGGFGGQQRRGFQQQRPQQQAPQPAPQPAGSLFGGRQQQAPPPQQQQNEAPEYDDYQESSDDIPF